MPPGRWGKATEKARNWRAERVKEVLRGAANAIAPTADSLGAELIALARSKLGGGTYEEELRNYNESARPDPWMSPFGAYADESVVGPVGERIRGERSTEMAMQVGPAGTTRLQKELYKRALSPETAERLPSEALDLLTLPRATQRALLAGKKVRGESGRRFPELVEAVRTGFIEPSPETTRARLIRALREPLRSEGLDIGQEARDLRNAVDKGILQSFAGRPENQVRIVNDLGKPYQGYTNMGQKGFPITLNLGRLQNQRGWVNRVRHKIPRSSPALMIGTDRPSPYDYPSLRSVLSHELGERSTSAGEDMWAPFATHAGPKPILNQLYMAGARNPELYPVVEEQIRNWAVKNEDGPQLWLTNKTREYGASPGRPLPPEGRAARKLVEALRREMDKRGYTFPPREEMLRDAVQAERVRVAKGIPEF